MSDKAKVYVTLPAKNCHTYTKADGETFNKVVFPEGFIVGDKDLGGMYISPLYLNHSPYYAGCKTFTLLETPDPSVWVRQDVEKGVDEEGNKIYETLPPSDEYKFTPTQIGEAAKAYEKANEEFIRIPIQRDKETGEPANYRVLQDQEKKREFVSIWPPFNKIEGKESLRGFGWTAPSIKGPFENNGVECIGVQSLKGANILMSSGKDEDRITTFIDATSLAKAFQKDFAHHAKDAAGLDGQEVSQQLDYADHDIEIPNQVQEVAAPVQEVSSPIQEAPEK